MSALGLWAPLILKNMFVRFDPYPDFFRFSHSGAPWISFPSTPITPSVGLFPLLHWASCIMSWCPTPSHILRLKLRKAGSSCTAALYTKYTTYYIDNAAIDRLLVDCACMSSKQCELSVAQRSCCAKVELLAAICHLRPDTFRKPVIKLHSRWWHYSLMSTSFGGVTVCKATVMLVAI